MDAGTGAGGGGVGDGEGDVVQCRVLEEPFFRPWLRRRRREAFHSAVNEDIFLLKSLTKNNFLLVIGLLDSIFLYGDWIDLCVFALEH